MLPGELAKQGISEATKAVLKFAHSNSGSAKKPISSSKRAGLHFPVGRVAAMLKKGGYASRVGAGAAVFMAAVLQYLNEELLDVAGAAAIEFKKSRIMTKHIVLAIRADKELNGLIPATIAGGGVRPHIEPALLPKAAKTSDGQPKKKRKAKKSKKA